MAIVLLAACGQAGDELVSTPVASRTAMPPGTDTPFPSITSTLTGTLDKTLESVECIKSFDEYAYVFPDRSPEDNLEILPLPPCQHIDDLPGDENVSSHHTQITVARYDGEQNEIWIRLDDLPSLGSPRHDDVHIFLVYKSGSNEWIEVSAEIENTETFVGELFCTTDDTIWGKSIWPYYHDLFITETTPILSKH